MLNGPRANFSYGRLHEVFRLVFKKQPLRLEEEAPVLILGFGAGSVVHILRNNYGHRGAITGIEHDEAVLRLGRIHFPAAFNNSEVIQTDVHQYLREASQSFTLIVLDLFNDITPLKESYEQGFLQQLKKRLLPGGVVYHNLMLTRPEQERALLNYKTIFKDAEIHFLLGMNQVIVAKA
ncbi:MAG: methyltransferase domain-containing protein [Owenweeksia sp.]|nr:methyltransferase domain-containing protein [Owenweeksia sp.]